MTDARPDPLVPAEVDLRGLPFMPLDTARLLDSDLFALSTGEEFKAAVALWCKAWGQVPAGSLPNDDRVLAHLSGTGQRWRRVRAAALRGFVECSDGRLYHPVIADKAAEAWAHRTAQRDRANRRWHATRGNADAHAAASKTDATAHAAAYPTAMQGTGTGTGTGTGKRSPPPSAPEPATTNPSATGVAKTLRPPAAVGRTVATWSAYAAAYADRYGVDPVRNRTTNGHLAAFVDRIGSEEAPHVAAHYCRSSRGLYVAAKHATNLLVRDAEALRTEWATGTHGTEAQARQADRTAATSNVFAALRQEVGNGTTG